MRILNKRLGFGRRQSAGNVLFPPKHDLGWLHGGGCRLEPGAHLSAVIQCSLSIGLQCFSLFIDSRVPARYVRITLEKAKIS